MDIDLKVAGTVNSSIGRELDLNELVRRAQGNLDNGESFSEICRRFTPLVMKYAGQNHLRGIFDEAVSVGWLAVVEAVRSFDKTKGINFAGYVDSRVKYAIWNLFKKSRRRWQVEAAAEIGCEGDEISRFDFAESTHDVAEYVAARMDTQKLLNAIQEHLSNLSPKQQAVIKLGVMQKVKLTDIAKQMKITPQAAFNLKNRGLGNLRNKLVGVL
ncbi:MAG: sigma-70 family RNA polymerase sigma factor [Sporomusaceae bacterium]|nr:sigma-70 family RNA polymerase sigma factor [Sporomusaceae bacterium]